MERDEARADGRLDELARRLEAVEERLARLENRAATGPIPAVAPAAYAADSVPQDTATADASDATAAAVLGTGEAHTAAAAGDSAPSGWADLVGFTGRTLVVLAGAFALRALTERGVLPQLAGTLLAFVYAALWLVLADRAADRRPDSHSAGFHGIAGAVIGFPLLWEATVQFRFLSPTLGAAGLALFSALGLAVAWRRHTHVLAAVVAIGSALTATAMIAGTGRPVLFASVLLAVGLATLQLSYRRRWRALAWGVAVLFDGVLLLLPLIVLRGDPMRVEQMMSAGGLLLLQLAAVVGYLGSFGLRAARRNRDLRVGETLQGIAVVVVGLGGALLVTRATDATVLPLSFGAELLAVVCYAASFAFIHRERKQPASFILFTSVALASTLLVLDELFAPTPRALSLAALALAGAWLGARYERATLSGHGATYAVAAAVAGGLAGFALPAFVGGVAPSLADLPPAAWAALAAGVVFCTFRVPRHGRTWGRLSPLPKMAVAAVLALGLGALVVAAVAPWLPAGDGQRAGLAVLRTAVLAASAVLLAAAGRRPLLAEVSGLVYPWLALGGVKLVAEDLRVGGPGSLLLSFALYGGALILAPRRARPEKGAEPATEPDSGPDSEPSSEPEPPPSR